MSQIATNDWIRNNRWSGFPLTGSRCPTRNEIVTTAGFSVTNVDDGYTATQCVRQQHILYNPPQQMTGHTVNIQVNSWSGSGGGIFDLNIMLEVQMDNEWYILVSPGLSAGMNITWHAQDTPRGHFNTARIRLDIFEGSFSNGTYTVGAISRDLYSWNTSWDNPTNLSINLPASANFSHRIILQGN